MWQSRGASAAMQIDGAEQHVERKNGTHRSFKPSESSDNKQIKPAAWYLGEFADFLSVEGGDLRDDVQFFPPCASY